jgi:hypothetical protein
MRKMWWALLMIALLVALTGCTEGTSSGIYSQDIPDPATQFLTARDSVYHSVWNSTKYGWPVAVESRMAYALFAIRSYRAGFETHEQLQAHLDFIEYPDGASLTAFGYRFKTILVWLRRGEIDLATAEKMLVDLMEVRASGMR